MKNVRAVLVPVNTRKMDADGQRAAKHLREALATNLEKDGWVNLFCKRKDSH